MFTRIDLRHDSSLQYIDDPNLIAFAKLPHRYESLQVGVVSFRHST